jgi:hypothetical protein
MPEEQPAAVGESEAEVAALAERIEAGTDGIVVPAELLREPDKDAPPPPQSLYAKILGMTVAEKLKLALRGNKDARAILLRDNNKLIRRFVLQNPRISDGEVIAIARNRTADDDLVRTIAERREWMRNYQVRLALATNPKTPLVVALKQVGTLDERDLRTLAKSKNVPQTVASQARRLLMTRAPR